jgi:hypothetical protein
MARGLRSTSVSFAARWRDRIGVVQHPPVLRTFASLLGLAVLIASPAARAQRLSAPLEAAIHLRALGYDRALHQRAGDTAVIAILYNPSSDASVQAEDDIGRAFRSLSGKMKVQGLPIAVKAVPYKDAWPGGELAGVAAAYVTPGLEAHLSEIRSAAARADIPTLCGDRDLAVAGLSIAAYPKGSSPGLTINLRAARAAGMDLDSRLLSIAEVLK